jgi:hypothetical protein
MTITVNLSPLQIAIISFLIGGILMGGVAFAMTSGGNDAAPQSVQAPATVAATTTQAANAVAPPATATPPPPTPPPPATATQPPPATATRPAATATRAAIATPTEAPALVEIAAPVETPTPLPDRTSCDAIRGTAYRSALEQQWFTTNCSLRPGGGTLTGTWTPTPVSNVAGVSSTPGPVYGIVPGRPAYQGQTGSRPCPNGSVVFDDTGKCTVSPFLPSIGSCNTHLGINCFFSLSPSGITTGVTVCWVASDNRWTCGNVIFARPDFTQDLNCGDFAYWEDAQATFIYWLNYQERDVLGLDADDGDAVACEDVPRRYG